MAFVSVPVTLPPAAGGSASAVQAPRQDAHKNARGDDDTFAAHLPKDGAAPTDTDAGKDAGIKAGSRNTNARNRQDKSPGDSAANRAAEPTPAPRAQEQQEQTGAAQEAPAIPPQFQAQIQAAQDEDAKTDDAKPEAASTPQPDVLTAQAVQAQLAGQVKQPDADAPHADMPAQPVPTEPAPAKTADAKTPDTKTSATKSPGSKTGKPSDTGNKQTGDDTAIADNTVTPTLVAALAPANGNAPPQASSGGDALPAPPSPAPDSVAPLTPRADAHAAVPGDGQNNAAPPTGKQAGTDAPAAPQKPTPQDSTPQADTAPRVAHGAQDRAPVRADAANTSATPDISSFAAHVAASDAHASNAPATNAATDTHAANMQAAPNAAPTLVAANDTRAASAPQQTANTPAAPQPALQHLAVQIASHSGEGAKHFSIRMDPAELGEVVVHLSVDSSGKAEASLSAEKPQTLALLQKDAPALERALRDAGVDVSGGGLNFSLKGQERDAQNAQGGATAFRRSRQMTVDAIDAAIPATVSHTQYRAGVTGLDIRV